jgi:phytoene dehydrogenase-like protein
VTSAFALAMTAMAHNSGWPVVRGGTGCLNGALQGYLHSLGVEFATGWEVQSLAELPKARTVLLDLAPRAIACIAREELPAAYRCRLEKFRYGPGVFKVDWALDAPIPWQAADCRKAATLHLGGAFEEILTSEAEIARGGHPRRPYVILAQPSLFDPSRAPTGKHTAWAYCHVPNGSTLDMTDRIEAQVERFAPGFRQRILARHTTNTREMEHYNPNYVGGDINAGRQDLAQFFTRPVPRWTPYSTPVKGLYICSSSTPPGGGVHGMCGYHAARAALKSDP